MNNSIPLDAAAAASNMHVHFADIDIICFDNSTETWAFHVK